MNGSGTQGSGKHRWHCKEACKLHHKLGYLFRSAQKDWGWSRAWAKGDQLARSAAQWAKELDLEKSDVVDSTVVSKPRVLQVQHSDATTVPPAGGDADDTVSIASTQPWHDAMGKRRCPRRRPGRRTRRREKDAEDQDSGRRAVVDSDLEYEVDVGRFPLEALPALAETLEDSEDDGIDLGELHFGTAVDSALVQSKPAQPHLTRPQPGKSKQLKRKLEAVEFEVVESDWFDQEMAARIGTNRERMSQFKPASFYMRVKIVLSGLISILDGPRPKDKIEVETLQSHIRKGFKDVVELTQAAAFTAEPREVLEIMRSHITEKIDACSRAPAPGMMEWCERLDSEFEDFDSLDLEDKAFFLDDVKAEMEEHKCQIEFCLESIDEVILQEA